jgi:hypothetical protein
MPLSPKNNAIPALVYGVTLYALKASMYLVGNTEEILQIVLYLTRVEVKTLSASVKYGWMSNFSDFQIVSPLSF